MKIIPAHEFDLEQMKAWQKVPLKMKLQHLTDSLSFFSGFKKKKAS